MIDWTDPKVEPMLHTWLKSMLAVSEATITFTKIDGSERVMKCTLEPDKLPKSEIKEDATPRPFSTSTKALRVFDLEKNEWRSFTIKNIKSVNFLSVLDI